MSKNDRHIQGNKPKPIEMSKAFAIRSRDPRSMRCRTCDYYTSRWCTIKASFVAPEQFACVYGHKRMLANHARNAWHMKRSAS